MSPRLLAVLLALGLVATGAFFVRDRLRAPAGASLARAVPLPSNARVFESEHYRIRSTAGATNTRRVAEAVESLYRAYGEMFPSTVAPAASAAKLGLVLYRDQAEFKRHNRSKPWAEAYYLPPDCHAYYGDGEANPYHWMLHEATHQLNDRRGRWPRRTWSNEALATYLGTSRIIEGTLRPGDIDPATYPVWWLSRIGLSGNLEEDLANRRIISLRRLLEDAGPPDGSQVNRYYIGYWSLAHFLLHADGGRHARGFRRVLDEGSTLAAFERHIGPVEQVQLAWYRYLRDDLVAASDDNAITVEL